MNIDEVMYVYTIQMYIHICFSLFKLMSAKLEECVEGYVPSFFFHSPELEYPYFMKKI